MSTFDSTDSEAVAGAAPDTFASADAAAASEVVAMVADVLGGDVVLTSAVGWDLAEAGGATPAPDAVVSVNLTVGCCGGCDAEGVETDCRCGCAETETATETDGAPDGFVAEQSDTAIADVAAKATRPAVRKPPANLAMAAALTSAGVTAAGLPVLRAENRKPPRSDVVETKNQVRKAPAPAPRRPAQAATASTADVAVSAADIPAVNSVPLSVAAHRELLRELEPDSGLPYLQFVMRRQRLIVAAGANEDRHPVARQGTHAMLVHACLREVMEKGAVRYRYSLVCTRIAGADSIVPPDVRVWEAYPEALFGISVRMSAEDIPALTAVRPDLNRKHARVMYGYPVRL